MKKFIYSVTLSFLLPFSTVQADIASDLEAGLPAITILNNALSDGLTLVQVMQQVASIDNSLLESIVASAIEAGLDARDVVNAAVNAGGDRLAMEQVAILAGADPADVTESAAAGGGRGLGIAPGQTGSPVTPPPFGSNAGGGGGGNSSPT